MISRKEGFSSWVIWYVRVADQNSANFSKTLANIRQGFPTSSSKDRIGKIICSGL